jgi:hypothetical protein
MEILKEVTEVFGKEVAREVVPIIVKKFLGRTQKLSLKFGLVLTFYEDPSLDEAISSIEICIKKFKSGVGILKGDDIMFDYYIDYEIEDFVTPEIDDLIKETIIEEPDYVINEQYVSLLEVLLFPHLQRQVDYKKEVEKIFLSGFKLLDEIVSILKNDEAVESTLKIRSAVKLLGIETELNFARNVYIKLSRKVAKLKLPYSPYISFSPISKIEGQIGQIIISLKDASILRAIIDAIM